MAVKWLGLVAKLTHVMMKELDGPVASVKGKLSDDLAPMDQSNGEEQV